MKLPFRTTCRQKFKRITRRSQKPLADKRWWPMVHHASDCDDDNAAGSLRSYYIIVSLSLVLYVSM